VRRSTPLTEQQAAPESPGIPERPALSSGVELAGELHGGGFSERQWLIQRNGRFIQLTELLYRIAERMDGRRTLEEIAAGVSEAADRTITGAQVRRLIQINFLPLALLANKDWLVPEQPRSARSPLRLSAKVRMLSPRVIEPITRVLQVLHAPPVLIAMLTAAIAAHGWLYLWHRPDTSLLEVFRRPDLLLATSAVMILAGIFHEFGHASGLRYGGGKVRSMGLGLYLVYPAFFTDVTDSYRLGRWARVRTDLGGFYFYLIFAVWLIGLYWLTGQEFLLLVVMLINIDILYQLLPFVRLDGYWAFADLTGIPDPLSQIGPFLHSVRFRPAAGGKRLPTLKPWVKVAYAAYIVLTIPVLGSLLFLMFTRLPRVVATLWGSLGEQVMAVNRAASQGDLITILASVLHILILVLLLVGIAMLLFNLVRRPLETAWRRASLPGPRGL
jgi:putative peptide zinc metalloprotease protein